MCSLFCMSFFLCGLGVVYPQNPQKPKATAEKIRHRTRQANSSRMRFIFCPLFCVLLRGFPFAAHIYTRRRAAFTIRRNTYFAGSARQPNPGTPRPKAPAIQSPANQGKEVGKRERGKAQPFKAKGKARERGKAVAADGAGKTVPLRCRKGASDGASTVLQPINPLSIRPRVCIRTPPICDQVSTPSLSLGYIPHPNCDYHRLGGGEGVERVSWRKIGIDKPTP